MDDDKIKGVSKSAYQLDDKTFITTVWRGMSKYIKAGDMTSYQNELMVKVLKREYTKGIKNENGRVEPFKRTGEDTIEIEENVKYSDLIIDYILDRGGLNHEGNGAYKQELSELKYPYRNFKSGVKIDVLVTELNENLNTNYTANELIDYVFDYCNFKKRVKKIIKQKESFESFDLPL